MPPLGGSVDRRIFLKSAMTMGFGMLAMSVKPRTVQAVDSDEIFEITKTDDEWRSILTPDQYNVLRKEA